MTGGQLYKWPRPVSSALLAVAGSVTAFNEFFFGHWRLLLAMLFYSPACLLLEELPSYERTDLA